MSTKDKKGGTKATPKNPKAGKSTKSGKERLPEKDPSKKGSKELTPETSGVTKLKLVTPGVPHNDGVKKARKNRLKKAGYEIYQCPITGLLLDIGPRANKWLNPTEFEGEIISWVARVILESKISPDELDKTADALRKK